jgi:hypothetical protein
MHRSLAILFIVLCESACLGRSVLSPAERVDSGTGNPSPDPPTEDVVQTDTAVPDASNDTSTTCQTMETRCGAECVVLQSDARHCGMCNNACLMGTVCRSGACQ